LNDQEHRYRHPGLQIWGGVECTVNRVGDDYFEQIGRSGHSRRLSDLNLFAQLGITSLRQPVLWECTAPAALADADWQWPDVALSRLRELVINPIVGLVHHGSGPRHTSLEDPEFANKLAVYAAAVAERYPWVRDYTPVNEPLTTARFSGLYGHWYPHGRSDQSFVRALLNQCRAVVLSMRAIRRINPSARLVQTEDLAKIFSTPRLGYQAEFENHRRWISFDLLCGRVDRSHALWQYLRSSGVHEDELAWFLDNSCPPDIVGLNHYLSGVRYLDEHLERYPAYTHGGNGHEAYADVLAVRVLRSGLSGPGLLLQEAWERYHLPLAITECHNGCTREEQLRWFSEVWKSAESARDAGINLVAVGAWALLGSFDWDRLLTCERGHYEPGVFDIRGPQPRRTALSELIRALAAGENLEHPLLEVPGWWHRPQRLVYGISLDNEGEPRPEAWRSFSAEYRRVQPLLITGAHGTLGRAFARICEVRGIPHRLLSRAEMDIANPDSIRTALFRFRPWALVNTAGYVRVDEAEIQGELCRRENTCGPALLADACADRHIQLLTFSSDLVFDGNSPEPYVESDKVGPFNQYGRTKAEAERLVLARMPQALVVRTSAFFGPWDEYNFAVQVLRSLAAGQKFHVGDDTRISPTYVPDLVNASLDLLIDREHGIWHLANVGDVSWFEFAERLALGAGLPTERIIPCTSSELRFRAPRPAYTVLSSERGLLMPSIDDAMLRFLADCEVAWQSEPAQAEPLAA